MKPYTITTASIGDKIYSRIRPTREGDAPTEELRGGYYAVRIVESCEEAQRLAFSEEYNKECMRRWREMAA